VAEDDIGSAVGTKEMAWGELMNESRPSVGRLALIDERALAVVPLRSECMLEAEPRRLRDNDGSGGRGGRTADASRSWRIEGGDGEAWLVGLDGSGSWYSGEAARTFDGTMASRTDGLAATNVWTKPSSK
jgi:hypothetical protein